MTLTSLSYTAVALLKANKLKLALAESCTGGMVAAAIVDVSGASEVFYEGVVTYSNLSKIKRLGVKAQTLAEYGAVSAQAAAEMAVGLLSENVDISVSITGIAGPEGGSLDKPVGTVWFGVADKSCAHTEVCRFDGDRLAVRMQAAEQALRILIGYINKN